MRGLPGPPFEDPLPGEVLVLQEVDCRIRVPWQRPASFIYCPSSEGGLKMARLVAEDERCQKRGGDASHDGKSRHRLDETCYLVYKHCERANPGSCTGGLRCAPAMIVETRILRRARSRGSYS